MSPHYLKSAECWTLCKNNRIFAWDYRVRVGYNIYHIHVQGLTEHTIILSSPFGCVQMKIKSQLYTQICRLVEVLTPWVPLNPQVGFDPPYK